MMVITICSFMLNVPGLRLQVYPKVVNFRVGRTFSRNLPAGKALHIIVRYLSFVEKYSGGNAQQLGDVSTNADVGVANAEELVDEATETNENGTDKPGTECTGGHIWVIVVIDDSADLGIGGVLCGSDQTLEYTAIIGLILTTAMRAASTLSS